MRTTGIAGAALLCCAGGLAFAQTNAVATTSAASYRAIVSPDSIASAWGSNLAPNTVIANSTSVSGQAVALPSTLGPVTLSTKDSGGATTQPVLYMVSPGQINYVIPANTAVGYGALTVNSTSTQSGGLLISNVAPSFFTFDASGAGVPVGTVLRVTFGNVATTESLYASGSTFPPQPINIGNSSERVYLMLYGTGFRRHSLNPVQAMIGDTKVPVLYADTQSQYPGFDQVNLGPLPQSLIGKGTTDLVVTVDGVPANTVKIAIQ